MGVLHCLDVGCADASVIVTDSATFLIDCYNIGDFEELLPSNKEIYCVFITHQHRDHYSGLGFLKNEGYAIKYMIYSPYERRYNDKSVEIDEWNEFNEHRDYFQGEGTELYTPYRQAEWTQPYWAP
jgi:glyoxylase-like metal-dependent hydrolase (beta-lactamase superfamily II)